MKTLILCITIIVYLFIFTFNGIAQITTTFTNKVEIENIFLISDTTYIPYYTIDPLSSRELDSLAIQDSIGDNNSEAYRFAVLKDLEIDAYEDGIWEDYLSLRVWKAGITSLGAKSLNLILKDLSIPDGGELYLISSDKSLVHGPITGSDFPDLEEVSFDVLPTDSLIILYWEPIVTVDSFNIKVIEIGLGYRGGGSEHCQIDVIEDKGDCFRAEQRYICKILINKSTAICTGSLIANTNYDSNLNPYVLSAYHCFDETSFNFSNMVFRFLDWKTNSVYGWVSFIGSVEIAAGIPSDFKLLELLKRPSASNRLFQGGWSISDSPPNNSTSLHHPAGDVMKITYDNNAAETNAEPIEASGAPIIPPNSAWKTSYLGDDDFGSLEGGSSGGPLINEDHKIVGQAHSITFHPCSEVINGANHGRLDVSWDSGSSPETRLIDWLDPLNTQASIQNSVFQINGSSMIPCPGISQDLYAPHLEMNSGTEYNYFWESSSNISITGSGSHIMYEPISGCAGCPGWVRCSILAPTECGSQEIANSVKKNLNWINPTPNTSFLHKIWPPTNNNGRNVGSFNNICAFGKYTITAGFVGIPVPSNTVFQWTYSGGVITGYPSSNGSSFSFTTNNTGIFTLTVQIIGGSDCLLGKTEKYTFQVLHPCSSMSAQHILSDGMNNSINSSFKVYPNPATTEAYIELSDSSVLNNCEVEIYNLLGIRIFSIFPNETRFWVDLSGFHDGVYLAILKSAENIESKTIIINNNK